MKITKNTITANDYASYFIVSCIGITESFLDEFNKRHIDFENKYSERFSKGELKNLTMSKYFKYGFASLTKNNYKFMLDLLSLFDDNIYFFC